MIEYACFVCIQKENITKKDGLDKNRQKKMHVGHNYSE